MTRALWPDYFCRERLGMSARLLEELLAKGKVKPVANGADLGSSWDG
ncbi:MAG TPA: hypothetical protein VIY86_00330 [Pirellulaceae bacterium]